MMVLQSQDSVVHTIVLPALVLAIIACTTVGCRCLCGDGDLALAQVVESVPLTEISFSNQGWETASNNAELGLGDALRTGESGQATLNVFGQGVVTVGPHSLVRFGEVQGEGQPNKQVSLILEAGELDVATEYEGAPALVLAGPSGERVILGQGTRVRWQFEDAERLRLDVQEGAATVERGSSTTEIVAGQSFQLGEAERLASAQPDAGALSPNQPVLIPEAGLIEEDLKGIMIRAGRASVKLKAPGDEGYKQARGGRIKLAPGTAIKVSGRRNLLLTGPGGSAVVLQPGAHAVFRGASGGRLSVGLNGGTAEVQTTGSGTAALTVPGGAAETGHLGELSKFSAQVRDKSSTEIKVSSGVAVVNSGGKRQEVFTGGEVMLGRRQLKVTSPRETQPVFHGSATLFDPSPTGHFTVRFDPIPECSVYDIQIKRRGKSHLNAVVDRPVLVMTNAEYGDYVYRAGCVREGMTDWSQAREGRVARFGDSSSHVALPTKAPRSSLDSDGRSYTVTYQNRLPTISLRWSKAPEASSYSLEVVDDHSGRKLYSGSSSRPARSFRSGFFREGRYYWFFRATSGGKRITSPITSASITFDNQAPAIQILEPRNGASASGSVRVRGVATVGSRVVANGVELDLSGNYRFDQQVPVRGRILVIQVSAPRRGTGYYIRHLNGG